jgi:5-methylcytosine-specific restriction endonuclease McrA
VALPWFRMYSEFATDPVVQSLSFDDQRHFVIVLCLKCSGVLDKKFGSNGVREGILKRSLGLDAVAFIEARNRLCAAALINDEWQPLNWEKRQQLSDSTYERVKRHRQRRAAAGLPQQNYIPPAVRSAVFARDGMRCITCGATEDLTLDHIVSELAGGSNAIENLQTLCRPCNASKRDNDNETFQLRKSNAVDKDLDKDLDTEKKKTKKALRAHRVPEDFSPDLAFARQTIPDLDAEREAQKFRDWEFKTPRSDWAAAWRNWINTCRESGRYSKASKPGAQIFAGKEVVW